VENFAQFLAAENVISIEQMDAIKAEFKEHIKVSFDEANAEPDIVPNVQAEVSDLFAPSEFIPCHPAGPTKELRFIDAIQEALILGMEKHPNLVLMGQDIAEYGGAFKVTEGFVDRFGKDRVRNTPLCESAIVGAALGLSISGMKAVMEMQFADFVTCGFNQIVNNLAKIHWRWGQNADVVVRMPTGAGTAASTIVFAPIHVLLCATNRPFCLKTFLQTAQVCSIIFLTIRFYGALDRFIRKLSTNVVLNFM
jgi:2-oxoisovalerate dehydrogenase E1 component